MPPCPSSSTSRYRPPRVAPISVTLSLRSSDLEALQVATELRGEIRALERHLHGRLEPAHRGAGVVAGPLELVAVDGLFLHQRLDGVGQLDLPAGPALGLLELVEDLRRQDIAADDRQVRR